MFRGVAATASRLPRSSRPSRGATKKGALSALLGNRAGYIMSAFFVCISSSHRSGGSSFGIRSRGAETLGAERIQLRSTHTLLSATHRLYYKLL